MQTSSRSWAGAPAEQGRAVTWEDSSCRGWAPTLLVEQGTGWDSRLEVPCSQSCHCAKWLKHSLPTRLSPQPSCLVWGHRRMLSQRVCWGDRLSLVTISFPPKAAMSGEGERTQGLAIIY